MSSISAPVSAIAAASSVAITSPPRSTVTRSAISRTSSRRCETNRMDVPSARSCRTIASSADASLADSAAVGSSMMMTGASSTSARAISTICFCAVDRLPARRARIDIEAGAETAQNLRGPALGFAARVEETGRPRLVAEQHVFRDAQLGHDHQLLEDGNDAVAAGIARRRELHVVSADANAALVRAACRPTGCGSASTCRHRSRRPAHAPRRREDRARRRAARARPDRSGKCSPPRRLEPAGHPLAQPWPSREHRPDRSAASLLRVASPSWPPPASSINANAAVPRIRSVARDSVKQFSCPVAEVARRRSDHALARHRCAARIAQAARSRKGACGWRLGTRKTARCPLLDGASRATTTSVSPASTYATKLPEKLPAAIPSSSTVPPPDSVSSTSPSPEAAAV